MSRDIVMTPCMEEGGHFYGHEGRACGKCPRELSGGFRCTHECHGKKRRRVVRTPS